MTEEREYLNNFEMFVLEEKEVSQCSDCRGLGYIEKEEMTCYHNRDYDYWKETCSTCSGHGKTIRVVKTVNVRPKKGGYYVTKEEITKFYGINESWKQVFNDQTVIIYDYLKEKHKRK